MDKIAVLIPCYNESKTVEKVVSDFRRVLPDATVYVYDNNSTDGTAELAARAGAVVRHEYQQGKGNVMRRMFREIDAEAYILVDGDDTYPAEAAPEMVAAVTGRQADMVVETAGSGHSAVTAFLMRGGVDTLICGSIGAGAQTAVAGANIRLYAGVSGDADKAVLALLAGKLVHDPTAVHCGHHDGEHHCGGHHCH